MSWDLSLSLFSLFSPFYVDLLDDGKWKQSKKSLEIICKWLLLSFSSFYSSHTRWTQIKRISLGGMRMHTSGTAGRVLADLAARGRMRWLILVFHLFSSILKRRWKEYRCRYHLPLSISSRKFRLLFFYRNETIVSKLLFNYQIKPNVTS
jgi:hypothetical protein